MDIFGAMLAIAAHWQIIVQNIAAQIGFDGSFLSTYLMSCSSRTSHQIVLQCSSERTIGFDPRYFVPLLHLPVAAASKYCLWQGIGDKVKG